MKNFGGVYKQLRWLKVIVDLFHLSILSWESKSLSTSSRNYTPHGYWRLSSLNLKHSPSFDWIQTNREAPGEKLQMLIIICFKIFKPSKHPPKKNVMLDVFVIDRHIICIYISSVSFHFPHPHCLSPASRHQIHWHLHPQLAPKFR